MVPKNALDNLKIKYQLVSDPEKINDFSHIILPGVGSAREAYNRLEKSGFVESIKEAVLQKEKKNSWDLCWYAINGFVNRRGWWIKRYWLL